MPNTYSFRPHARRFIVYVRHEEYGKAEALLRAHPEIARDRNAGRETPLHWLAIENELRGVELLLAFGAEAQTLDDSGASALADAANLGLVDVARLLLKHGASVQAREPFGDGPILLGVARLCTAGEMFDLLIAHGADVHDRDHLGNTPLHGAADAGNVVGIRRLLAHGADRSRLNDWGETPFAALRDDAPMEARELLSITGSSDG